MPIKMVIQTTGSYAQLNSVVNKILAAAHQNPHLINLDSDLKIDKPQIDLKINRNKAGDLGIPMVDIGNAINLALGQPTIGHFIQDGRRYDVFAQLPDKYSLKQNFPNPFNPCTTIKYSLPVRQAGIPTDMRYKYQDVRLIIYDVLGREITTLVDKKQKPGNYEVEWDASGFASGIYLYQIKADKFVETKKLLLLK